jgi:hypothetical protein
MRQLAITCFCLMPLFADAHSLVLRTESDGRTMQGTAYYSNGEKAAYEAVSILDLSTIGAEPVAAHTNAEGNFSFQVNASHRYRLGVYGIEGHKTEIELSAQPTTNSALLDHDPALTIDHDSSVTDRSWLPLAMAVIGGVLLMSLVPFARARGRPRHAPQSG